MPAARLTYVPEEKRHRKFMPGTKITLKARKARYFLGENILLDYQVSYDGEVLLRLIRTPASGRPIARSSPSTQTERNWRPPRVSFAARDKVEDPSVEEIPNPLRSR